MSEIAEVSRRIRTARKARGWTQQQLADAAALHRMQITKIESGHGLSVPSLVRLADAFGVSVESLIRDVRCSWCRDRPPAGFTCNACKSSAP